MAKTVEGSTFLYLLDFRLIERAYPRTGPTSSFRNFRVPVSRSALLNDVAPVLAHGGADGGHDASCLIFVTPVHDRPLSEPCRVHGNLRRKHFDPSAARPRCRLAARRDRGAKGRRPHQRPYHRNRCGLCRRLANACMARCIDIQLVARAIRQKTSAQTWGRATSPLCCHLRHFGLFLNRLSTAHAKKSAICSLRQRVAMICPHIFSFVSCIRKVIFDWAPSVRPARWA